MRFWRQPPYMCIWCCLINTLVNKKYWMSVLKYDNNIVWFLWYAGITNRLFSLCTVFIFVFLLFYICHLLSGSESAFSFSMYVFFFLHREVSGENINTFLHQTLALVWTGFLSFPQPSTVLVHSVTMKSQKCHLEGNFAKVLDILPVVP